MGQHDKRRIRQLRELLFERQGGLCHYCGVHMRQTRIRGQRAHPDNLATLEHLVLRSKGGATSILNCVVACHRCNSTRGDMPLEDWDAYLSAANEARHGQAP